MPPFAIAIYLEVSIMKKETSRINYQRRYDAARHNLLLVIIFSVINCLLVSTDTYFLFSGFIPLLLVNSAYMLLADPYTFFGIDPTVNEFLPEALESFNTAAIVLIAVTVVVILLYFLCWIFSKKRVGWLVAALVLFSIDCVAMVYFGLDVTMVLDILFHALVMYYLISGIVAHNKLKNLPLDEPIAENAVAEGEINPDTGAVQSSTPLYYADNSVKSKVLVSYDANGCHIEYRRVKKTNELVINGSVYDTYEALVELPHSLHAVYNGMNIEAGTDTSSRAYIAVDGEIAAKKIRLV